ncbi:MAG: FKBP-type peptidyl-prolyl cis-trans isomerase [Armatimonadetes bacterium]|nr:hypothetical protein [Armatimonadota bacterium]MBS1702171.1 FKBP-type peptidyl-prolyl cis-trans isomerase [Armatimonadota bacterium]MBS1725746.1 FKBP-type peptidyl-prolyl cis-trans isomerase [Armatimonadota bacterium]
MTRYAYLLLAAALLGGCTTDKGASNNAAPEANNAPVPTSAESLKVGIKDIVEGKGKPIANGDTAIVFYIGKLTNGKQFDANMNEDYTPKSDKEPFAVQVGMGQVIKGWEEGLIGAKEGGVRQLHIPWQKAYGAEGQGATIPPKADLNFTIKIQTVYHAGEAPQIFANDIKVGSGPAVTPNSTVTFTYVGKRLNGQIFDDQTRKPLVQPVSNLIPGFKEAIIGMKPGGRRLIKWPPGSPNPTGMIPGNQPVEYTIDIIAVK